jgi:hypothetical protein
MAFVVRKGVNELFRLTDTGDAVFSPAPSENASVGPTAGELAVGQGGVTALDSKVTYGLRMIRLHGQLHDNAVLPGVGLQIEHNGDGPLAELSNEGDLYVRGAVSTVVVPANPAVAGPFTVTNVVYAAPGLTYDPYWSAAYPGPAGHPYTMFTTPSPEYLTRTIDISDFSNLAYLGPPIWYWGFESSTVPINGLLRVPDGSGPFPVAVFAHGNHTARENSTPGYVYLLDLLASHGILAASLDCNFLNGDSIYGENDARAIVHLEHVRQFAIWNSTPGHPLFGKVDLDHIMIIGHSRGGEAVSHASVFNRLTSVKPDDPMGPSVQLDGTAGLGPYNFSLSAVVAIAPSEGQYLPVTGPSTVRDNYFVIHGSRDGDLNYFMGQRTFDRAHPIDLANPTQDAAGHKSLLWVIGANHNYFNSVWLFIDGSPTIPRAAQENVARVYIGALAQATLLGRTEYLALLRDYHVAWNLDWIPPAIKLTSQYQDPRRIFVDHYEHLNATAPSPPVTGTIAWAGLNATELDLGATIGSPGWGGWLQETHAVKVVWTATGGRYTINISPNTLTADVQQHLVLRCGQTTDIQNQVGAMKDFTVTLGDGVTSFTTTVSEYQQLHYPAQLAGGGSSYRVVMQTVRVPLQVFANAGVNVSNLQKIELAFDVTPKGSLLIDDIQLSE